MKVEVVLLLLLASVVHSSMMTLTPQNIANLLKAHNDFRANVNPPASTPIPDLVWSDEVAASAARNVETCTFSHKGAPYGENIAGGSPGYYPSVGWELVVTQQWGNESSGYNIYDDSCTLPTCLHYTQVVWANTLRVGCARYDGCPSFPQSFISCQYDPPGNWAGQKPYTPADQSQASASETASKQPVSITGTGTQVPASVSGTRSRNNPPASLSGTKTRPQNPPSPSPSSIPSSTSTPSTSSIPSSSSSMIPPPAPSSSSTTSISSSPRINSLSCKTSCINDFASCILAPIIGSSDSCRQNKKDCLDNCNQQRLRRKRR